MRHRVSATLATLILAAAAHAVEVEVIVMDAPIGVAQSATDCTTRTQAAAILSRVIIDGGHIHDVGRFDLPGQPGTDFARIEPSGDRLILLQVVDPHQPADPLDRIDPDALYGQTKPASDGIGKTYRGRQIAQVMGHLGAAWLERSEREQQERTDLLVELMQVKPDDVIADIGAGSGYFTLRLAPRVPAGQVVAVDIQPEMNQLLEDNARSLGITNIKTVLGDIDDVKITPRSVDIILLVDAYHEFSHPWEMKRSMMRALKPGGRIVLVEYREEDPEVHIKPHHKMTQAQAIREFESAGFQWVKTHDDLPQQHVMVFQRPANPRVR